MRIACIHLPSFPIQVHVRHTPTLAGTSFAVAGGDGHPTILACSIQAWREGVRPKQTIAAARSLSATMRIFPADPELYRRAASSIGDGLMTHSEVVDVGEEIADTARHRAFYVQVPTGHRGATYGSALLGHLAAQGLKGRVGVADDCFTAWAAAVCPSHNAAGQSKASQLALVTADEGNPDFVQSVTAIPRGGAAAFLAPLALELLPLPHEIRQMLRTLGIETLGDFATLPPPSAGQRWQRDAVDYQSLANGNGPVSLRTYTPDDTVAESIESLDEIIDLEPLSFLISPLVDRACVRLRGRGRAAARIGLTMGTKSASTTIEIVPTTPTLSATTMRRLLRIKLSDTPLSHPVMRLTLTVERECAPDASELDAIEELGAKFPSGWRDDGIPRLQDAVGGRRIGSSANRENGRSQFRLTPFAPKTSHKKTRRAVPASRPVSPRRRRSSRELILPGFDPP